MPHSVRGMRGPSQRGLAAGAAAILAAVLIGLNVARGPRSPGSASGAPDQAERGRSIYIAECASCHGRNLEGQAGWQQELPGGGRLGPPHDATGHTWHHPDTLLFDIIKRGGQAHSPPGYQNNMPAFESRLSDEEVWAVLAYIKSTWPPDIRAAQEQANQQAR